MVLYVDYLQMSDRRDVVDLLWLSWSFKFEDLIVGAFGASGNGELRVAAEL